MKSICFVSISIFIGIEATFRFIAKGIEKYYGCSEKTGNLDVVVTGAQRRGSEQISMNNELYEITVGDMVTVLHGHHFGVELKDTRSGDGPYFPNIKTFYYSIFHLKGNEEIPFGSHTHVIWRHSKQIVGNALIKSMPRLWRKLGVPEDPKEVVKYTRILRVKYTVKYVSTESDSQPKSERRRV